MTAWLSLSFNLNSGHIGAYPYHLAHGLLDHAAHLAAHGEAEAAAAATGEAAGIARRLRCQPLLDRADTIQPTTARTAAS
jgi:hypothetical protein